MHHLSDAADGPLARWWNGGDCIRNHSDWACGASGAFAHVSYSAHLKSELAVVEKWNASWLTGFSERHTLQGARVVDYGIGAGLLGVELLTRHGVAHYTGIDIANRSLDAAIRHLRKHQVPPQQYALLRAPQEFAGLGADMFISHAVIQHFPSEDYAKIFFANLQRSGIPVLLLQFKHASPPRFGRFVGGDEERGATFERSSYAAQAVVATLIDEAWLLRALPSYRIGWKVVQYYSSSGKMVIVRNLTHLQGRPPKRPGVEMVAELTRVER